MKYAVIALAVVALCASLFLWGNSRPADVEALDPTMALAVGTDGASAGGELESLEGQLEAATPVTGAEPPEAQERSVVVSERTLLAKVSSDADPLRGLQAFVLPATELGGDRELPPEPYLLLRDGQELPTEGPLVRVPNEGGDQGVLLVEANGRWSSLWLTPRSEDQHEVVLRYGYDVRVRVQDAAGLLQAGRRLRLVTQPHTREQATAVTAANGEARLRSGSWDEADKGQGGASVRLASAYWPRQGHALPVGELPREVVTVIVNDALCATSNRSIWGPWMFPDRPLSPGASSIARGRPKLSWTWKSTPESRARRGSDTSTFFPWIPTRRAISA